MTFNARTVLVTLIAALGVVSGCGSSGSSSGSPSTSDANTLRATIGPEGGTLVGATGSALDGVRVVIPPGAVVAPTDVQVRLADVATPLPATATRCGPTFEISPAGLQLALPASVTLPFDQNVVDQNQRFEDEVKVWTLSGDHWAQTLQTDSVPTRVTFNLGTLSDVAPGVNPPAPGDTITFKLLPNPKFVKCLAAFPDDPARQPSAEVIVVRGDQRDSLNLNAHNIKAKLAFDMFTVEHSALGADGKPDPAFTNFGLAWYQSDLEANDSNEAHANIRTILLDQIFGFDPGVMLPPTNTFHVGFWFNDPNDAAPCGFDVTKPTPFNGDHKAGPLAMISLPDAATNLGPLCTKPDTSVSPARCSP